MKTLWLFIVLYAMMTTSVLCFSQFEDSVDASTVRVSALLADDALFTESYKVHPNTHLLRINALRYSVLDLTTSIRDTLIRKYAGLQHPMTAQQKNLIKLFDLQFTDIPLPNVFTMSHLEKLETQLSEMKWQLSTARSHLKVGWFRVRTDYSAMLITCARIVNDYVTRYNSIRLLGDTPPPPYRV